MSTKIKVKKINPPVAGRKPAKPGKAVLIKKQSKKLKPKQPAGRQIEKISAKPAGSIILAKAPERLAIAVNAIMPEQKPKKAEAPNLKEETKAEIVLKSISQEEKAPAPRNELSAIKNLEVNKIINIKDQKADKISAVNKEPEEKTAGKDRSITVYRKIAYSFIILTIMLLAAIFYFSFVKVTITVLPKQESLNSNLIVDIIDKDKGTAAGGAVAGEVKQAEIEQSKIYAASGIETVGEEVAGKITVINDYNRSQQLVATTRFLSPDNKLFRLKNTITVPAGGRVEADVYADEISPEMAIGPSHFTIPGLWAGLQDKIYGESKEPMKYSQQVKKYIQQADIETAVKDLRESLLAKAKTEIGESYKDYSRVIYDIDDNSISREVGGKAGEEKDEFSIVMKTKVIVVAFNEDDIFKLAEQKLNSILSDDKKLLRFEKDNISYGLNNYNINQGLASLNASFSGEITAREGANIVERDKILGLSRQQLDSYLKNMPEIADYEIKFYPSFINKVPNLADRIEIEIKN